MKPLIKKSLWDGTGAIQCLTKADFSEIVRLLILLGASWNGECDLRSYYFDRYKDKTFVSVQGGQLKYGKIRFDLPLKIYRKEDLNEY